MGQAAHKSLPAGRVAARWYLFLVFYHLLPVPWFMVVVGGLAPGSFLFAIGAAGLFNTDFDSLPMAVLFLAPALVSGLVFVLLAYLLAAGIGRLKKPLAATLGLAIILVVCIGVALNPVYISGGHSGSYQFSLLDFLDVLGQWRIPSAVSLSYFICLALLLAGLLIYQHMPQRFPTLPLKRECRRRLLRRSMLAALILFMALFCWTHRLLFFVKPLADMGIAGAQYHLALALQKGSGSQVGSGTSGRYYLERAAEQGHIKAAMALARSPRNVDDKLRWLTVAAEGGLAEAHYELYRFMVKSAVADYKSRSAMDWLQSAAESGFADAQYEFGRLLIRGAKTRGINKNSEKARQWWEKAAANNHGRAMEELSWRYNQAADGFPWDPKRAIALLKKTANGYRHGRYGLPQNQQMASVRQQRAQEIKALEKRIAKGDPEALVSIGRQLLRSPISRAQGVSLLEKAASGGDAQIQYELGRQILIAGSAVERQKGLQWIERSAGGGYAEAQYRLVTYYENQIHIMRDNPSRGVALLQAAAEQNHLRAMGALALAYEKGRYRLAKDYRQSQMWYQKLLRAYDSGQYQGDVDDQFIRFQRKRLEYVTRARQYHEDRARRYAHAGALERQIMEIEDRNRLEYQKAVNDLYRGDGRREGQKQFRARVEQLRQQYIRQRELAVEKITRETAEGN